MIWFCGQESSSKLVHFRSNLG